jgi:gamma-glutamylcysteine synthetase
MDQLDHKFPQQWELLQIDEVEVERKEPIQEYHELQELQLHHHLKVEQKKQNEWHLLDEQQLELERLYDTSIPCMLDSVNSIHLFTYQSSKHEGIDEGGSFDCSFLEGLEREGLCMEERRRSFSNTIIYI